MRIGIYTMPLRFNYGGLLQAWALQKTLQSFGHEVITFNPCPYRYLSWKKNPYIYGKRLINKMLGRIDTIFLEEKYNKEYDIKNQNLVLFVNKYINTQIFQDISEINVGDYDVLITGSDQVWRPRYVTTRTISLENSFLDFARDYDIKKIAYAASFGTDDWEFSNEQSKKCSELAKRFSAISVREDSGIYLCKKYLGVNAAHVLDPTMLHLQEDYIKIIENGISSHMPDGDLLCYILDESEEKKNIINKISRERKLTPFKGQSDIGNKNSSLSQQIQPSVEQWLRNFMDSSFVITDSFHACVFSIIFNKPFIAIANSQRGLARFKSLFKMLGLESHLISSYSDYNPSFSYSINKDVYKKWAINREKSIHFLRDSLNESKDTKCVIC